MYYTRDIIDFLELSYGKGMMSLGGDIIEKMFDDIEIKNKTILDLGCGLGGIDIRLAHHNNCRIIGIDINDFLIKEATDRLKKHSNLQGNIYYKKCIDLSTLEEGKFDIAFSKNSIFHVKDKKNLFKIIKNFLNIGGELIVIDWFCQNINDCEELNDFLKYDCVGMQLITKEEYIDILNKIGFNKINHLHLRDGGLAITAKAASQAKANQA